ncbi:MAG: M4 family metallopeptidase [Acidobacteria bacterium]|nr:M4 family metallopeptidase [Acidobacteriota bacterium]MCA1649967.1 M4 family metallopeptidase [Acidobacteriota bacterium]
MRLVHWAVGLAILGAGASLLAQAGPTAGIAARSIRATTQDRASLRTWDATIDGMLRQGQLVIRKSRPDTQIEGRTHERYDQYFEGVRVVGGDVARQFSEGVTESIFGALHTVSGISTRPRLSAPEARKAFETLSGRPLLPDREIELVILPRDEAGYALAYRTHVWRDGRWMHTFLDAHSGAIVLEYSDRKTQAAAVGTGTGVLGDTKKVSASSISGGFVADDALRPPTLVTYDMQGNFVRADAYLDGVYQPATSDIANDTDNVWTDGANVDAHAQLGWTYDYYFKRFGRRGLDDNDTPIFAITHPVRRSDINTLPPSAFDYIVNAFWCDGCGPAGRGVMVFGEGLPPGFVLVETGQYVDYLAGALDIVAHELTHGLTAYSSRLVYRNESGALDEAFADIVGTSVEFFYQSAGSGSRQADYLMGEDVFRPGGIRSMSNPGTFGDPDHYSRRFTGEEDEGGVHINAGIPNQAFYLAIEGGVNRTSGLRVTGVGAANRDQIEKVFYRAFAFMLTSTATFSTARATTIQAARDLYGAGSPAERAIVEAWTAVGVQ